MRLGGGSREGGRGTTEGQSRYGRAKGKGQQSHRRQAGGLEEVSRNELGRESCGRRVAEPQPQARGGITLHKERATSGGLEGRVGAGELQAEGSRAAGQEEAPHKELGLGRSR